MKVGIDTRDLYLAKTGTKTVLVEVCRTLKKNKDLNVVFLEPKKKPTPPKTKIEKIFSHFRFFFWKQVLLPFLAKQNKVEILLCNDYVVPYFKFGYKTFPVFHGANFWEQPENYNKLWLGLMNIIAVPSAKRADKILTVSEFSKKRLSKILNIDPGKLAVFHLAPKSLNDFKSELNSENIDLEKHLSKSKYLLHVGVMEKRKNLCRLIEAFYHSLEEIDSQYKLILVGQPSSKIDSDDSKNVLEIINKYELNERVITGGYVSDEVLSLYYRNADFYIFPSYYEGFGIPILEAFQYGLAVASSSAGSLPEVGGNAVHYFDPFSIDEIKKSIIRLANDREYKIILAKKGQERVKEFHWEKTARQLIQIFYSNNKT